MRKQQRCLLFVLAITVSSFAPGCVQFRNWCGQRFSPPPLPCELPDDMTQAELVTYLNENTKKIWSWRTTRGSISVHGRGILVPSVGAMIAVESPRNFRLVASSPMGNEVDLGSNEEHFWFWNKHSEEKYVYQASHDQEPERMRRFPIPFQPDWIMETLGVIGIDPDQELTMQPPQPGSHTVLLMADRVSPQGFKVRKVTAVDLCRGVIREHALYDARGQLIARAVLSNHYRDQKSQAVLPSTIQLEWPQANLNLTMNFSDIEVNPPKIPRQTWTVPNIPDSPVRDMTQ